MFNSKTNNKNNQESKRTMATQHPQSIETLIGHSTRIKGDMKYSGSMHVDGHIEGSLVAETETDTLMVSETGRIHGTIKAGNMVINGTIEGDITASGKIEVASQARITGNIYYTNIEMEAGSQVNGQLIYQGKDVITPIKKENKDGK